MGKRRRQNSTRRAPGKISVQRVTIEHAAAVFVDQFLQRDSRWCEVDTRSCDAPAYRERAKSLTTVPSLTCKPRWSLLDDRAHPVQRFHVCLLYTSPSPRDS